MKKTVLSTVLLLLVIISALPAIQYTGDCFISAGWGMYDKENVKAMGPSFSLSGRLGYDFNRAFSAFGETTVLFFTPSIQKSNFVNVRDGAGLALGGGCAWAFNGGFSISATGGFYIERFDNDIARYESGLYLTIKPKLLVLPIKRVGDFFNVQIALPCSFYFAGGGYRATVSIAVGLDCSEHGRRNK